MLPAACADAVRAFFILLHLLERRPSASPSFVWDRPSIIRRKRTRLPTYLSVGCAPFFGVRFHLQSGWRRILGVLKKKLVEFGGSAPGTDPPTSERSVLDLEILRRRFA